MKTHHRTGFVVWLTGLSGAGKSTLAALVGAELDGRGVHAEILDGDEIREHISKGLGFSKEDRDTNVRRIGYVAKLLARNGACAVVSAISPYAEAREEVRRSIPRFCEVYCHCPLQVLRERDPKGLYERAARGELKHFTGVDDPYEPPRAPELTLHTDREPSTASARRILHTLEALGFLDTDPMSGMDAGVGSGAHRIDARESLQGAVARSTTYGSLPRQRFGS